MDELKLNPMKFERKKEYCFEEGWLCTIGIFDFLITENPTDLYPWKLTLYAMHEKVESFSSETFEHIIEVAESVRKQTIQQLIGE
jgi:hypothetical protein